MVTLNRPPRIREELISIPRVVTLSPNDSRCQKLTFSAQVEDPDVGDRLRYRFYSYPDPDLADAGTPNLENPAETIIDNIGPNPVATRTTAATFTVDLSSTGQSFYSSGSHMLELWVSDGEFSTDHINPDPPKLYSDGGIASHFYVTTYMWQVHIAASCP